MRRLYTDFMVQNEGLYLKTIRYVNEYCVYERNPFLLSPFTERLVCNISIDNVYSL